MSESSADSDYVPEKDFLEGIGGKPKGFGMYGAAPVAVGAGLLSGQQENENVLAPSL